jgi:hypothetical protein
MHEAKFDIGLKALFNRGKNRVQNIEVAQPSGREMIGMAYNLLDQKFAPYDAAVAAVQKEGEEAARAAEEVALAEVDTEEAFAHLHATGTARLYELKADPNEDADLYERRMSRGMPLNPSEFSHLGVDRTSAAMATAIEFMTGEFPDGHAALERAREAHANLKAKLEAADSEEAERVAAMQALFDARTSAKRAYSAARKLVDAALSLDGSEERISQLMPPLSSIYDSATPSTDEPVVPDEPVEPVEA